ncbi:hypothetical protein Q7P37_008746 [Cladosporium fusiforme]
MNTQACRAERRCSYELPIAPRKQNGFSGRSDFGPDQTWVTIPPKLDFHLENFDQEYSDLSRNREQSRAPGIAHDVDRSWTPRLQSQLPCIERADEQHRLSPYSATSSITPTSFPVTPQALLTDESFQSGLEICLLRHYVLQIAPLFDFFDPKAHFAFDVPCRARSKPMLANALLALSARHAHLTRAVAVVDEYLADRYNDACLQVLKPTLASDTAVEDDDLLATLCLLRLLEEIDVSISGIDLRGHLIGAQAIIRASQDQSPSEHASHFRQACLWASFRQELYIGLKEHRPVRCQAPRPCCRENLRSDWDWAQCAVSDCAEVVNCVFAEERNCELVRHLSGQLHQWQSQVPRSFEPLGAAKGNKAVALEISDFHLLAPCHVMAWQYNLVASALLCAHQPLPMLGPQRKQAIREMDNSILSDVRKLCSIAETNNHVSAASMVASMGISMFGERFDSPTEQKQLDAVLAQTELEHGWPTKHTSQQLHEVWDV